MSEQTESTRFADTLTGTVLIHNGTLESMASLAPNSTSAVKIVNLSKAAGYLAVPVSAAVAFAEAPEGYKSTAAF